MYKGKKVLITLCARGGSKGVPHKNIKSLGGKPLIQYSSDLLKECSFADDYILSTDCPEIKKTLENLGFSLPYQRPKALALDHVSRVDAIQDAVLWMEKQKKSTYDLIIDFGVATPFKNLHDLELGLETLFNEQSQHAVSVCKASRSPYFNMVEKGDDGFIRLVKPPPAKINSRQLCPEVYDMNDAFNIWHREALFLKPNTPKKSSLFVMPTQRSIDIDRSIDFEWAEFMLEKASSSLPES